MAEYLKEALDGSYTQKKASLESDHAEKHRNLEALKSSYLERKNELNAQISNLKTRDSLRSECNALSDRRRSLSLEISFADTLVRYFRDPEKVSVRELDELIEMLEYAKQYRDKGYWAIASKFDERATDVIVKGLIELVGKEIVPKCEYDNVMTNVARALNKAEQRCLEIEAENKVLKERVEILETGLKQEVARMLREDFEAYECSECGSMFMVKEGRNPWTSMDPDCPVCKIVGPSRVSKIVRPSHTTHVRVRRR